MDILRARARAVLVPFAEGNESEQALRAGALAERGWAEVVPEAGLTARTLAAALDVAASGRRPPSRPLRLDGAAETARLVRTWLAAR